MNNDDRGVRLNELARVFLKLGVVGFGGPAAHIAMMEDEVVVRRKWLTHDHFLDLVGATNLIPGPNSTEMAIHVGYQRAGLPGLAVAGACFIVPAVIITAVFAWMYKQWGALPAVAPYLFGIKPAVLAVIAGALWRLGRKAVKRWELGVVGILVMAAYFSGVSEVAVLLGGGVIGMVWLRLRRLPRGAAAAIIGLLTGLHCQTVYAAAGAQRTGHAAPVSLWKLSGFFLKVGAVLYGSGYVLVAFLERGLVHHYGWLTHQQLLDAIAIGQFTPGPVLSTATFIGYQIAGAAGAVVATLGIFLPSFLLVAALNPLVPRLRKNPWLGAFLDAVNVSAVGLMAAVLVRLAAATLTTMPAVLIAAAAAVAVLRFQTSPVWLVLVSAIAGRLLVAACGM